MELPITKEDKKKLFVLTNELIKLFKETRDVLAKIEFADTPEEQEQKFNEFESLSKGLFFKSRHYITINKEIRDKAFPKKDINTKSL